MRTFASGIGREGADAEGILDPERVGPSMSLKGRVPTRYPKSGSRVTRPGRSAGLATSWYWSGAASAGPRWPG